jgi:hypothetical protein
MRLTRTGLLALGAVATAAAVAGVFLGRGISRPPEGGPSSLPGQPPNTKARSGPLPTQGQLARTLASRFGLGDELTEDRAIGLLASRGIVPESGWTKSGPATETVIAQVQKTVHVLLTGMANDLKMQVPATLNVFIFDPGQIGGQTYHVGPRDMSALLENGGVVRAEALKAARSAPISIDAPHPYPIGDDRLPPVWTYRLRRPGAGFIRVHFETLDLAAPSHVRILDRYGQEGWRYIGGEPKNSDIWASAVGGDTAIIVLHAGAVAAGNGLRIDRYSYGASTSN